MCEKLTSLSELGQRFTSENSQQEYKRLKDQKYDIVSRTAYLIGVREEAFGDENKLYHEDIYKQLDNNKNARIIRNLSILRTAFEIRYHKLFNEMRNNGRTILCMSEYIPQEILTQLSADGINLTQKSTYAPIDYILEINRTISERINNCKSIYPDWVNWEYIKDIFLMPGGLSAETAKDAGAVFTANLNCYPYQLYINWPPKEEGNILLNDKKFLQLLYHWHYDDFTELSKVTDVSTEIKADIYQFIQSGSKIDMIVDCENSDVYNIISMLQGLDWEYLEKISKIILVNDVHTNIGWNELNRYTDIPIEHMMTERVKEDKSVVDGTVIAKAFIEYYEENVDSFILLSSDSDYWTLIDSLKNKASIMVMVEHSKCSPDYKNKMNEHSVFFCYLDDFYSSGASDEIKTSIILKTLNNRLEEKSIDLNELLVNALTDLRINLSECEMQQFYKKYLKTMQMEVDTSGRVRFFCK